MYGASPAKFRSFPPPAITLPPPLPLPPHDDPWPTSAPLKPSTPLAEPAGAEAYDQEIGPVCHRSVEAAAPDYTSTMSVPQRPETPPMLAVLVKWVASVAVGFKTQLRCDLDM